MLKDWCSGALGIASAIGSLIGILVSSGLTGRRNRTARRAALMKQQLEEFYGPWPVQSYADFMTAYGRCGRSGDGDAS